LFENSAFRRTFGLNRDEVTGEWKKLHKKQLHDLYSSPTIVRVTLSRIMRWAGHVVRVGREQACTGFRGENLRERVLWENLRERVLWENLRERVLWET
jgi:hypothetical protein